VAGLAVRSISAGAAHNCEILPDDTVQCWGLNREGQTLVRDSLVSAKVVAAGGGFSCAIAMDDSVQC
jgi:hypothetical protein